MSQCSILWVRVFVEVPLLTSTYSSNTSRSNWSELLMIVSELHTVFMNCISHSALKIKATSFSAKLVTIFNTARRQKPENHSLNFALNMSNLSLHCLFISWVGASSDEMGISIVIGGCRGGWWHVLRFYSSIRLKRTGKTTKNPSQNKRSWTKIRKGSDAAVQWFPSLRRIPETPGPNLSSDPAGRADEGFSSFSSTWLFKFRVVP
jgi:hypothetical protein